MKREFAQSFLANNPYAVSKLITKTISMWKLVNHKLSTTPHTTMCRYDTAQSDSRPLKTCCKL